MSKKRLFSSEACSCGHPDYVATAISDAILDYCVASDKKSRCGIEVMCVPERVILGGEITTKADLSEQEIKKLVRETVVKIGYTQPQYGFYVCNDEACPKCIQISNYIHQQSPDINQGVDRAEDKIGAGDQGIMFGFANDETEHFYPLAAAISNQIMRQYHKVFLKHQDILSPDAKTQVTINYTDLSIDTLVVAASHKESVEHQALEDLVKTRIIIPALQEVKLNGKLKEKYDTAFDLLTKDTKIMINTTGKFVICGPVGDAGITGRKLAVDSYGGYARLGGGNTHGKDASKSDFSFAVYSRYLAKNLVAAGIDSRIEIQLASAIGVETPVAVFVKSANLTHEQEDEIAARLAENLDMTCYNIINSLHLLETNRLSTNFDFTFGVEAQYKEGEALPYYHPWEALDLVGKFKELFADIINK